MNFDLRNNGLSAPNLSCPTLNPSADFGASWVEPTNLSCPHLNPAAEFHAERTNLSADWLSDNFDADYAVSQGHSTAEVYKTEPRTLNFDQRTCIGNLFASSAKHTAAGITAGALAGKQACKYVPIPTGNCVAAGVLVGATGGVWSGALEAMNSEACRNVFGGDK